MVGLPPDSPLALDFDVALAFLGIKSEAEAVDTADGKKKPRNVEDLPLGGRTF